MADINEQICKAVDIIVSKKLESINFDSTIIATIVDNSEAEQYKYICSNGSSQFVAYAKETNYKINESVYVTIPNNDYDQQKIIIGKYVAKDAKPYIFKQPFETIIDLSGNLIQTNNTIANSLLANNISNIEYCENLNRNEILERLSEKTDNQINKNQINEELSIDVLKLLLQFIEDGELKNQNFKDIFNSEQSAEEQENIIEQLLNRDNILEQLHKKTDNLINEEQINEDTNTFHLAALLQAIKDNRLIGDYGDIFNSEQTAEEQEKIIKDLLQVYESVLLWEQNFEEGYAGFDRLGLQAQFRSWISAYNTVIGDYGLKLFLYSDMGKTIEKNKDNEKNFLDTLKITEIKFGSQDMYGNPYNFQSFMEQESVFDISGLGNIYRMELYFYQAPNTFKDKDGNLIPYQTESNGRLPNNLFVKDPYICLGYNLSDFTDEQVIISTLDSKTYIIDDDISPSDISKYIRLRWIHKFENGDINVVNESSKLSDYEIRWYRYELGAPSADQYSGVYWESVNDGNDNKFDYTLIPRKKHNEELIKAIVIYNGKSYTSNILTFTNEREVINDATIDFLNGLSIVCEDNSYGNYCIYGQNNNLFDADQANRVRELQAYFGFSEQGQTSEKLQEATKIVWEFPLYNSMIVLDGYDYYKGAPLDGYYTDAIINKDEKQGLIQIIRNSSEDGKINSKQDYRIQRTYNQTKINNTIRCTITKNQIEYSASKDFTFGLMGTNGTDATVVIDFDDNKVALTADRDEALSLRAHLYDSTHKEIDLNNIDLNLSCEWSWYKIHLNSDDSVQIKQRIQYDADGKQSGEDTTIDVNKCFIEHLAFSQLNNQFLILQVKIKGWGDYDLISYKAIPIRKNRQYRNYIGPTDIVYNSSGYADYYKQPFELWWCDNLADIGDNDNVVDKTLTIKAEDLQWQIGNPFNEQSQYLGTIKNNILKPVYVYTKDSDPYSIICKQDNNIVWIQPLVIIQNQYPSTTINKWDGKEISMEGGVILTPAIAAGKKNKDDNTFSGVMIGAWGEKKTDDTASDITEQTGVYGFHHGAMSYAFKEDGTGFIGKSGNGRIIFNGDTGQIKSQFWDSLNAGMFLDMDNGILKLQKNSQYEQIDLTESTYEKDKYYVFKTGYNKIPLNEEWTSTKDYYLYQLNDLGLLTKNEFIEKQESNNSLKNFYQKNISYIEASTYSNNIDYYVDGYTRVIITKEQYDESVKNNKSTKYYILKENFALANSPFDLNTIYYSKYQKVEINEQQYNNSLMDNKSTRYYIYKDNQYQLSEGEYSSEITYYIEKYSKTSITKEQFDSTILNGKSTEYYILLDSFYILSDIEYSVNVYYYMKNKVKKIFNTKDEFDKYKNNYKVYIINNINYTQIISSSIFYETQIYAIYKYTQCYYDITGPEKNSNWNTASDPNLIDGVKYTASSLGSYYSFKEGFQLDSRDKYTLGETYYILNMQQEQRFITLSAEENRYPLSIGTTNAVSQRKFRVEWDGTVWIENGNIQGIITAEELYCDYGYIGGWEIDSRSLSGGKTVLDSIDGIYTNNIGIIEQISSGSQTGILGEIGLVYGSTGLETTYNIGIMSKNQSIILDTTNASGTTANIALRSRGGTWAQCSNFYVMGNSGGWLSNAGTIKLCSDNFELTAPADNQIGIYARFG